jgi:glycerol kinase
MLCLEVMRGALETSLARRRYRGAGHHQSARDDVIMWDRETGRPMANAIVWQCTRTRDICQRLIDDGHWSR